MNTQRVTRSQSDRLVAGVAGGLAAYFKIDPILVRIAFVVLVMLSNVFGVLAYLGLWLLLPRENSAAIDTRDQIRENIAEMQGFADGIVDRIRGLFVR